MNGLPASNIHPKLRLYLECSPMLDMNFRFLPHSGGWVDQDYQDIIFFQIIEQRVKEIINRKKPKGAK